ncbi:MAG: hypothetical protein O4750_12715 [Trichodesmium sp. St18_bin3_1_1]|nr:hypothetical protein [Trichodesmium sp. St18_bin3_1_1]
MYIDESVMDNREDYGYQWNELEKNIRISSQEKKYEGKCYGSRSITLTVSKNSEVIYD